MVLCIFYSKDKSIIKTNKDNQMKEFIPTIILTLVVLYVLFVGYSLWNSFTTIEKIEEIFIETPIIAEDEIRG